PRRRMNDKPSWLVDDDDRSIFVDDVEQDLLRLRLWIFWWWHIDADCVTGRDAMRRIADRAASDCDPAVEDQGLQPRARQIGDCGRKHPVKPRASEVRRHQDAHEVAIATHCFTPRSRWR